MFAATENKPEFPIDIARLLANRYGDGGLYVPRTTAMKHTLRRAIEAGFVSKDGFVTRKGRSLVARSAYPNLRG